MSEAEYDRMKTKLNGLSQRIDVLTREFKERGELSDSHQSSMIRIQERRDRMQHKLASAESSGTAWDVIKIELERDFSSIHDDLLQLNEELDAGQMKQDQK